MLRNSRDRTSVSDPHWFQCRSGSGSSNLGECEYGSGSGSGFWIRIQGFDEQNWKNLQLKKILFGSKLQFTDPQASMHKATGKAVIPQKRTFSFRKLVVSPLFSIFEGHFCPHRSWSGSSRPKSMQIHGDPAHKSKKLKYIVVTKHNN